MSAPTNPEIPGSRVSFISGIFGILVNLYYPKLDAENDTEIVKQSMSSMIAVFAGMGLAMIATSILIGLAAIKLSNSIILLIFVGIFTLMALLLWKRLTNISDKRFDEIQV